jgi:hypothetical protein
MDAEQKGRRWPPRSRSLRWLTFGLSIIVLGASVFALGRSAYDGGLYVRPSIHYQVRCSESRQCVVTIQHAGGGFDHGFNPAYPWAITGDPVASLHFSTTSGTLQAHQSVQVSVAVAPGACPTAITITSKTGIVHFSPFLPATYTGQCRIVAPVISA